MKKALFIGVFMSLALLEQVNAVTEPQKCHILVVPGHEPTSGGANYKEVYERDLTAELGTYLVQELRSKLDCSVLKARDEHSWAPDLTNYFAREAGSVLSFKNRHQWWWGAYTTFVPMLRYTKEIETFHLYAINKYADEQDYDMVLHLHFNDDNRKNREVSGLGRGFTIAVPAQTLVNADESRVLAKRIFAGVARAVGPSLDGGAGRNIFGRNDLIALGAYNTLRIPSVLIEYGFVYDPLLQDPATKTSLLRSMATSTVAGINKYYQYGKN